MSASSYQSDVARLQKEISDYDKEVAREYEKVSRLMSDISSLERSLRGSSASMAQSKVSQIASKTRDLAASQKRIGDIGMKKANKQSDLGRKQQYLRSALEQEARSREQVEKRRRESETRHARDVTREMERQRMLKRQIETAPQFIDLTRLPEKIKVLFLASSPQDQGYLRLDVEVRSITEKIRASEHRDAVDLVSRWAVRTSDLLQHLNEHSPDIVHFSGHGSATGDIIFEGPDGSGRAVTKDAIVQLMNATAGNIRLVIFNSCFSRNQAEAVTKHIDAAVGMNASIGDEAAEVFAAQFYSAIGFGKSVKIAFEQGKIALILAGIPEENTPELFTRDGVEAENIYIVRPENATSVAAVRSPTSVLPDLKQEDVAVLKAACESEAGQYGVFMGAPDLNRQLEKQGLTEEAIEEAIVILNDRGYLKSPGSSRGYFSVTDEGFDRYATAFLPTYGEMTRRIADAIVHQDARTVEQIRLSVPDAKDVVVERILNIFEAREFVHLMKPLGSLNSVTTWSPTLKRWLEEQKVLH